MKKWYIAGEEMTSRFIFVNKGYTVSSAPVSRTVFATGCAAYVATKAKIGLKEISIPVRIVKNSNEEADNARSWLLSICLDRKVDVILPNGKRYTAALINSGETKKFAEGVLDFKLEFSGYQRGEKITASTPFVFCESTVPETPYKITATVGTSGTFSMAGITFSDCAVGDVITIDGMAGRLLLNGAPINLSKAPNFIKFPMLTAGENNVACSVPAEVEYYPIYM